MRESSKVLQDALSLPAADRAHLAAVLIQSLDAEPESDSEEAWRAEVARRVRELDEGLVEAIDWDEARRQILG